MTHRILRVLVWGLAAIFLVAVGFLVIVIMMPTFFRLILESGTAGESGILFARGFMMGLGGLGSVIFNLIIAVVVILVLFAVGLAMLERKPSTQVRRDEALAALRLRYAKGEITKEQYVEMKKTLET